MINNKYTIGFYKLFFGALGLSALITEIVTLMNRSSFNAGNFFSYFTVESNLFAAIVLVASAIVLLRAKTPRNLDLFRGAATLYMVTTGVLFSVLLSGYDSSTLTAVPWDNIVLHYIMPLALFVDWLIDPPKSKILFKQSLVWLAFPIAYLIYSLIRGSIVNWYPYPFLNPDIKGFGHVAVVSVGAAIAIVVLTWLLTGITAKSPAKRA